MELGYQWNGRDHIQPQRTWWCSTKENVKVRGTCMNMCYVKCVGGSGPGSPGPADDGREVPGGPQKAVPGAARECCMSGGRVWGGPLHRARAGRQEDNDQPSMQETESPCWHGRQCDRQQECGVSHGVRHRQSQLPGHAEQQRQQRKAHAASPPQECWKLTAAQ